MQKAEFPQWSGRQSHGPSGRLQDQRARQQEAKKEIAKGHFVNGYGPLYDAIEIYNNMDTDPEFQAAPGWNR